MNMIKALWWRFQQCLGTFTIFLVEGPLKPEFLGIYLTTFSESIISKIQNLWGSPFLSKCLKFKLDFKNAEKNWEKPFCCWDNCIWIGIVKFSLLRKGYISSATNMLTSSLKFFHINKRYFLRFNWLGSVHWIWRKWCDADLNSALACLPCYLSKWPLKRDFLDIYLTTFSE